LKGRQLSSRFFGKKRRKKLLDSGTWGVDGPQPVAQIKRGLFASFSSEKEVLA
jgi:hypothetical protein